jgi:hypothetical protein
MLQPTSVIPEFTESQTRNLRVAAPQSGAVVVSEQLAV